MTRKAAHQRLATGLQKLTRALGVPVAFLRIGATEAYDPATGAVTVTGGETVTVEAASGEVSDRSVAQGLARRGDLSVVVEERLLRTALGASFEPARGGAVTIAGRTYSIVEVASTRDGDGTAIVFELLVRA